MPYIQQKARDELINRPEDRKIATAGELNFMLSRVIETYLDGNGRSYQSYNDIVGALDCLKMEVYARMVRPYEDEKIRQNGDVFKFVKSP